MIFASGQKWSIHAMAGSKTTCNHEVVILTCCKDWSNCMCTDKQMQWNKGVTRNLKTVALEEMDYKKALIRQ